MDPKERHSTIHTLEDETLAVVCRHHTLTSVDDCLDALLERNAQPLHRLFQRHGISQACVPWVGGRSQRGPDDQAFGCSRGGLGTNSY